MKRNRITALLLTLGAALSVVLTGCGDSSSSGGSASYKDNKDYGGYSKEYWDAARDAWDANTP